ncbi:MULTISPECIES: chorismate lyase [Vibrio]|uniref:Probable chorismate pyruvate-lyase n=1 Tax=Vibrio casei TaxID=673372 RepID=A0A368LKV9_9VIBR|nr:MULTISPECIES: chorismate lyase [Vibrio]RCS72143.1 chorismate lyase [Vibrio casei]SJN21338.1 Chorismate--pyruvate lyase [Vibrio casei]HBV76552.1 chorismate lyase [Vibrio sp.]
MKQDYSQHFNIFARIDWQQVQSFHFADSFDPDWLLEQGSLSRLFSKQCHQLTAHLVNQRILPAKSLTDFQCSMLFARGAVIEECLLREVVLAADDIPWLLGSTLIPRSSLSDEQFDLTSQGEVPLGLTVFQADQVARDGLHLGKIDCELGNLAARSSRLWMNQKPMLVAELFLPPSPIYRKD